MNGFFVACFERVSKSSLPGLSPLWKGPSIGGRKRAHEDNADEMDDTTTTTDTAAIASSDLSSSAKKKKKNKKKKKKSNTNGVSATGNGEGGDIEASDDNGDEE
jgi:putative methyltransferase